MRSVLRTRVVVSALAGVAGLLLASGAAPAQTATATVQIKAHGYVPDTLTVAPGTKVTWTNTDDDSHTVVDSKKAFRSSALDTDDTYSFTFNTPGEYDYFCSLHPYMVGKIIVK